jgi:acetylornithine/succinyldiaminopimelate/putrescine aminotransferase
VQGESGVWPAEREFLEIARSLCTERGALLIFDEIQCGMGRLGSLFAFESYGVRPDVITMAKALANGLPIGAVLLDAGAAAGLQAGDHGTTFGGSPVPCAAALAHLRVRDSFDLDAHVRARGMQLRAGLAELGERYPETFGEVRGAGLMLGLAVREPLSVKAFVDAARTHEHLLVATAGHNTLRFLPPLVIGADQIDDALARLERVVAQLGLGAAQ